MSSSMLMRLMVTYCLRTICGQKSRFLANGTRGHDKVFEGSGCVVDAAGLAHSYLIAGARFARGDSALEHFWLLSAPR